MRSCKQLWVKGVCTCTSDTLSPLSLSLSLSFSLPLPSSLSLLFRSLSPLLSPAALRFCRRIVGLKDEFYNRYIVRNNLFKPIIKAFIANGCRYNLINSAIIELFEYIKLVSLALAWTDRNCTCTYYGIASFPCPISMLTMYYIVTL